MAEHVTAAMVWPIASEGAKVPEEKDLLQIWECALEVHCQGEPGKDHRVVSVWERGDVGYQVYCEEA